MLCLLTISIVALKLDPVGFEKPKMISVETKMKKNLWEKKAIYWLGGTSNMELDMAYLSALW